MSCSSSAESNQMLQGSEINPDLSFNQAFNSGGQHKHTPNHGISNEISENFNKLAKAVNSKSSEYKSENTSDTTIESSSDEISASKLEKDNNAITDKMNDALDVFFQFEDTADSESRDCSEFQTERAIIREMCNVVIKKLDFNKEWDLES